MTAAVEGMPCLARRASSLKTNHQLGRSCRLIQQVWQTTVRFLWMENSTSFPERLAVIFNSYLPLSLHLRKRCFVLLIGDRDCNSGSHHYGWKSGLPIRQQNPYWIQKDQDVSMGAQKYLRTKALAAHKWIGRKFGVTLEMQRWKISVKVWFGSHSVLISKSTCTELKTWDSVSSNSLEIVQFCSAEIVFLCRLSSGVWKGDEERVTS